MKQTKKENRITLRKKLFDIIINHAEQGKIPPERILAEMLNVNRFTLRQCLEELMEEGKLYRKPRKGTYVHQLMSRVVGLVTDMGKSHPYANMMDVVSGICHELDLNNDDNVIVRFLNPEDPEELGLLIRQYEVDSCIVATGGVLDVAEFLKAIPGELHYKFIFVSANAYAMKNQNVEYNYVEMASVGKLRVRQILENGGKNPAIITVKDNPSLPDIRKELEKHDLPWDETLLIHDEKKVKKLLDKWIREKKADSVMCDGISNGIFHTLFETLQSHPEFTGPVSISDTRFVRYELKKYPSLPCRICFSHHTTEELGIEAARMALRAAESRKMQPPVFVQCAYPEKESSN